MIILDPSVTIRDISADVIESPGRPRILPASYYESTNPLERAAMAAAHALYSLPTVELVEWLRQAIGGRTAIEIGAGNGVLADALGIPATDSFHQTDPKMVAHYATLGRAVVNYGANVEKLEATAAVEKHRPQVVIGCWVTHKYNPRRHSAGGFEEGVDEEAIIDACETFILVGNSHVHRNAPIWHRPHTRIEPDWLYSSAYNGTPNFIAVWGKQ